MNDLPADNKDAFSAWLRERAESAGYKFDGPRAGGLSRLAEDSGVTISVISRALAGERMPDVQTLRSLAKPLGTNLREMLIRSGQASGVDLPTSTRVGVDARLTDDERIALEREMAAMEQRVEMAAANLADARAARDLALQSFRFHEARAAQAQSRLEGWTSELHHLRARLTQPESARQDG